MQENLPVSFGETIPAELEFHNCIISIVEYDSLIIAEQNDE